MNRLTIKGNLGRHPEMKETKNGKMMTKTSIAVSRRKKVGEKEYENVTDWFNVVWWDYNAKTVHDNFWKGKEILIEGTLQNNNYEKDGQKIYQDQIIGDRFHFCGPKGEDPRAEEESEQTGGGEDSDGLPF